MATSFSQVPNVGNLARLSFWSELALEKLPPGRYVLQVTATDRAANRNAASQLLNRMRHQYFLP